MNYLSIDSLPPLGLEQRDLEMYANIIGVTLYTAGVLLVVKVYDCVKSVSRAPSQSPGEHLREQFCGTASPGSGRWCETQ